MKYLKITTTNKLYLLTLTFIFVIILINQSVFAQSENPQTRTDKRMIILERYLSWINNNEYGDYKVDQGKKVLAAFNSYLSAVIPANNSCLKETDDAKLSSCKEKIKFDYKLARKFNRVLKYYQIQDNKPNVCVKADMGIGQALRATAAVESGKPDPGVESEIASETSTPKSTRLPVYLCTDGNGNKLVRVLTNDGALVELSSEDAGKPEFQIQNLPPKDSFDLLVKKLGLTAPSGEIFASPNPCTIPAGAQTCEKVRVEWDVSDETSDPVEVKTKEGEFIKRSRNGSSNITNIGSEGDTFILYSLGRKIGEVFVRAIKQ